jgi:DNA-binding CsgD family transcriptional regulator
MENQLRTARHLLQEVIWEQRAATEELRSTTKELEALLEEFLAGRSDLRKTYEEAPLENEPAEPPRLARDFDLPRLERDARKFLEKARETMREAMLLRLRSKRIRAALRSTALHRAKPHAVPVSLSKRERQVLALIVEGKSSKEIAAVLGISFKTAVTHRASIMGKFDVHEIASVVREAIRRGLV